MGLDLFKEKRRSRVVGIKWKLLILLKQLTMRTNPLKIQNIILNRIDNQHIPCQMKLSKTFVLSCQRMVECFTW